MRKELLITFIFMLIFNSISTVNSLEDEQLNIIVLVSNNSAQFTQHSISETNNKLFVAKELDKKYDVEYVSESLNAISLSVTESELKEIKLRKDIQVARKIPELHLTLQDSISIINASLTGNLQANGVNLTGTGQTICIIDSGVNYMHESLGNCTTLQLLGGNCSKIIGGYAFYDNVSSNKNDVMDNSVVSHGTHVAGIVAGSGLIRGVAPDAKIVAIKACDSNGNCDGLAVLDGINWCISNSSIYNISVISMSLGTGAPDLFDHYCDEESPEFSSAINSAIAKNISVVIAAGNDGSKTHISLPACIRNATAVGATDKSDNFASYSNRNALVSLFSPGSSINSTILSGGYGILSGTSMATPHVAGAIAVIRQLLDALNVKETPIQIVSRLNNSGKKITDITGINYSRIDLYSAAISIGNNVTAYSPIDGYGETGSSVMINFNFSLNTAINTTFQSCSLYSNSNNLANVSVINQSDMQNISLSFIPGTYSWKIGCISNLSNVVYSEERDFTISASVSVPEPAPPASSSSGGGGGGSTSKIYAVGTEQISSGYTQSLRKGEKIQFEVFDSKINKHTLSVDTITQEYVNITIRSEPIKLTLSVGQSAKINLTSNSFYNLLVKLEKIESGKALITIQNINDYNLDLLAGPNGVEKWNLTLLTNNETNPQGNKAHSLSYILPYLSISIFAIALATIVCFLHTRKKRRI